MSPLPDIAHWWAIEAMIASYNHVYKVIYGTRYETVGAIGVSDYGSAPIASFELELLALDDDPVQVIQSIREINLAGRTYILDVFHASPVASDVKARYTALGYDSLRTGPILGRELPGPARGSLSFVKKVETSEQVELANRSLSSEGETISLETLSDPRIHNFIAEKDGQVVGWAQLVTIYPGTGYVNQLFMLPSHRRQRIGSALIERIHMECDQRGLSRMVLVSSEMALELYRRLGYRPLAYFTAFRPKEG